VVDVRRMVFTYDLTDSNNSLRLLLVKLPVALGEQEVMNPTSCLSYLRQESAAKLCQPMGGIQYWQLVAADVDDRVAVFDSRLLVAASNGRNAWSTTVSNMCHSVVVQELVLSKKAIAPTTVTMLCYCQKSVIPSRLLVQLELRYTVTRVSPVKYAEALARVG